MPKKLQPRFFTGVEALATKGLSFVVRLESDRPIGAPWVEPYLTIPVGEVSLPDTPVTYHERNWRLVRIALGLTG